MKIKAPHFGDTGFKITILFAAKGPWICGWGDKEQTCTLMLQTNQLQRTHPEETPKSSVFWGR